MRLSVSNPKVGKFKVNLLYLSIITLITVITWIGFSVYISLSVSKIDADIQNLIKPINPTLDSDTLTQFKQTRIVPPSEFKIISVNRQNTQAIRSIIDPFNNRKEVISISASSSATTAASDSASLVEPDSEMVP